MEYHTQIKLINNNAIDMLCGKLRLPIGVDNTVAILRGEVCTLGHFVIPDSWMLALALAS
jgi:hypothetical protein